MRGDKTDMRKHKSLILIVLTVISVPFIFFLSNRLSDERRIYIMSFALLLAALLFMFLKFEFRKPAAREIVLISVMCAFAVCGRAVFFMLPQFKPTAAIVIISGIAFGAEDGFLIGSLSAFISNILFGQSLFTPWQMLCFGIIGFLAGILFEKRRGTGRITVCVFGFISVIFIYGGIMNPVSSFIFYGEISLGGIMSSFAAGFYFDLIHAASTAIFLAVLYLPVIKKINRVKTKYGLE